MDIKLLILPGLLFFLLITPLFFKRNLFFLFAWIFIIPFFDMFTPLMIGSTSLMTYLLTGLSCPVAISTYLTRLPALIRDWPEVFVMFLFLLTLTFNLIRAPDLMGGIGEVLASFILIFTLINLRVYFQKGYSAESIFKLFNLFVTLNCLAALFQRATGFGLAVIEGVPRVKGFLGHPNGFAFLLNLYLPLSIYKCIYEPNATERKIWAVGTVFAVLGLLITFSKTSFFLFGLMMLIMFFYIPVKIKVRISLLMVGLLAFLIISDVVLNMGTIDKIAERFNNNSSMKWRLEVWQYLMAGFRPENALLGSGIDSSKYYLISIDPNLFVAAHNVYIQMFFNYGLSAVFYFLPFFMLLFKFWRASISRKIQNRIVYIVPFVMMVEMVVDMYASNSVLLRSTMYFGWVIVFTFYWQYLQERRDVTLTESSAVNCSNEVNTVIQAAII